MESTTKRSTSHEILIIDDDDSLQRLVAFELETQGLGTRSALTAATARNQIEQALPNAVLLDLDLPDTDGFDLLEELHREHPALPIIVLTSDDELDDVVRCMRLGADDYVTKPFDSARLLASVQGAIRRSSLQDRVEQLTDELRGKRGFETIVGESASLTQTTQLLQRAAALDVDVLLTGESGTGKELAANALHNSSKRRSGAFVALNCGAIPVSLIESELFGHERGAFTGAARRRVGLFEQANGGTLFLDEIGEMPFDMQVRLLRVLEERTVQRIGGSENLPIDVRIVSATNRDLQAEIAKGRFREDLFYRLAVFPVSLPPLREREHDVLTLADRFLSRSAAEFDRPARRLTPDARHALLTHDWPGNVRELKNVITRAAVLADGVDVDIAHLSLSSRPSQPPRAASPAMPEMPAPPPSTRPIEHVPPPAAVGNGDQQRSLAHMESTHIERVLRAARFNIKEAARQLGIGRATLYRKIAKHGLSTKPEHP